MDAETPLNFADLRQVLSVALICDALDAKGFREQSPSLPIRPLTTPEHVLLGRCKTTLWADMAHDDPAPYALELEAVDSCQVDDVIVCAASGSTRSGIWGELLSTAARNAGCVGAVVDGAVRDVAKMRQMQFPVHARCTSPRDSLNRQRVIDIDVPVEVGGVVIHPGDVIAADQDGVVVIPCAVEEKILSAAWAKANAEDQVREAIRNGMTATEAFDKFGIL